MEVKVIATERWHCDADENQEKREVSEYWLHESLLRHLQFCPQETEIRKLEITLELFWILALLNHFLFVLFLKLQDFLRFHGCSLVCLKLFT